MDASTSDSNSPFAFSDSFARLPCRKRAPFLARFHVAFDGGKVHPEKVRPASLFTMPRWCTASTIFLRRSTSRSAPAGSAPASGDEPRVGCIDPLSGLVCSASERSGARRTTIRSLSMWRSPYLPREPHSRRIPAHRTITLRGNQDVKRRAWVVRSFLNRAACLRLASALASEWSEEWLTG